MQTGKILEGDVLDRIAEIPDGSVQCVVTSPPYWGLRDYGVDGQIGLETTPDEWVAKMVEVFREVRRTLREDGTVWLNLGDAYAGSWGAQGREGSMADRSIVSARQISEAQKRKSKTGSLDRTPGLKPKDLIGQPWRAALALQADGWYLRSDIIFHKPNPMPESVTDRPTKSHEYIFLLTKSARYFYDADAVREKADQKRISVRGSGGIRSSEKETFGLTAATGRTNLSCTHESGRNARTVWTIPTQAFPDAHFATFPEEIPRRCIKAGTSQKGSCAECGSPWMREIEATRVENPGHKWGSSGDDKHSQHSSHKESYLTINNTLGWKPQCECNAGVRPCVVLDPFHGSGTTGMVALGLGRDYVGIELNPECAAMSRRRFLKKFGPLVMSTIGGNAQ